MTTIRRRLATLTAGCVLAMTVAAQVFAPPSASAGHDPEHAFAEWYAVPENAAWFHFYQWLHAHPHNEPWYWIVTTFGTGRLGSEALRVAWCESQWIPTARSAGGDLGLFQINPIWFPHFMEMSGEHWSALTLSEYNAGFARLIYDTTGGWKHWSCQP